MNSLGFLVLFLFIVDSYVRSQFQCIACCIVDVFKTISAEQNTAEPARNDDDNIFDINYLSKEFIKMS